MAYAFMLADDCCVIAVCLLDLFIAQIIVFNIYTKLAWSHTYTQRKVNRNIIPVCITSLWVEFPPEPVYIQYMLLPDAMLFLLYRLTYVTVMHNFNTTTTGLLHYGDTFIYNTAVNNLSWKHQRLHFP